MNEWILIVKNDVYKYETCKRLMIKAKMDIKTNTTREKINYKRNCYTINFPICV